IFLIVSAQPSMAQTATLSLSSVTACSGDTVMVSLNATNLFNVGAITLYIGYDTAVLKYHGQANVHPNFPGLLTNAVTTPLPQVNVAWNSLNPGNLESGKLVDLKFIHKNNSSPVFFRPGGEIVTINLIPIMFSTEDGMVNQLPPYITAQPQNTIVHEGHNAIFTVVALQADNYQWQQFNGLVWTDLQNTAVYQNVNGPQLTIVGVSIGLNNYKYRCRLTATGMCQIYSNAALLNVIPGSSGLPTVYDLGGGGTYCEGLVPSGINITLSNSQINVNYQLYNGPAPHGPIVPGSGSAIMWDNVPAGLYMANATNIFGTVNMNGTVIVDEHPLPEIECPSDFNVLISSPPFPLEGATPTGGEYIGPGVAAGVFNPETAGLGIHEISYLYTDENNCTNICTFQITVISPFLTGDANGDGVVNILDAVVTVAFIMGNNPQPFIFEAADVNGDGMINIQDVVLIVNIIMGQ
ncbi:MAG TPA: hypothetical protein ENN08_06030, partial [Bacteroidales bacterium]|nr:hypothetical protein [Bacteroidales bacterium]